MSLRGVRQLRELVVRYSDLDGSSRGVRDWIREDLVRFAAANPELAVRTELKRAVHPLVRGQYLIGTSKTISLRNMEREDVEEFIMDLRNQIGKKVLARKSPVERALGSVQGEWHERMPVLTVPVVVEHKN